MTTDDAPATPAFDDFGLDPRIVRAVTDMGFENPTPIQTEAIPILLDGRDVVGGARTGSGKTAAFGLPLLHRVREGGAAQALVLAPTRELAIQVSDALESYGAGLGLRQVCIYGGSPYPPQLKALRQGATVIVGTPGRLLDHMERGSLDLSDVKVVVLDEADEMLRMGFIEDVEKILAAAGPDKQVALFSATMPGPIKRVAKKHLVDPVEVQVEQEALTVDHIEQRWILVPQRHKLEALQRVLRVAPPGGTLVFARTRKACAELADALAKAGVGADALHGDLTQAARERVLNRLRAQRLDVLVATDVAARGLDVDHLGLVINVDLPDNTEIYVHRIGRTGRAGRDGMAVSFVTPRERRQLLNWERTLGVKLEQVDPPSDAAILRAQKRRLLERLEQVMEKDLTAVREWMDEVVEDKGWDAGELAAAAMMELATMRHLRLDEDASTERVSWSQAREKHAPKGDGPDPRNEVELFIPLGRNQGTRPADIVGALANEAGIPGKDIGRITLFARNSFVGLPRAAADHVLQNHRFLEIRGQEVELRPARGNAEDREREARRGERGDRPERGPRISRGGNERGGDGPPRHRGKPRRFDKPKGFMGKRKKTPRGR